MSSDRIMYQESRKERSGLQSLQLCQLLVEQEVRHKFHARLYHLHAVCCFAAQRLRGLQQWRNTMAGGNITYKHGGDQQVRGRGDIWSPSASAWRSMTNQFGLQRWRSMQI